MKLLLSARAAYDRCAEQLGETGQHLRSCPAAGPIAEHFTRAVNALFFNPEGSNVNIPDTVQGDAARATYEAVNAARGAIKEVAQQVKFLADIAKKKESTPAPNEDRGETIANLMLTYRHLEDASMRLGKALQAIDGGVSVYDKATTVGA